jgi:hypothetical protein
VETGPNLQKPDEGDFFNSLEFRLDALGEGYLQYGLTKAEFEELFSKCIGCDRYLAARGRHNHICLFSEAEAIPEDEDALDFLCKI